ncbi:DUF3800 domain-containing protein [Salmonella enterica]|nr:DUF3800 domain-containing protein [Salmonella enterica]
MNFYIDESGNFSLKNSTWNSVGILAIPHQKEEEIASFVKTLKNKLTINSYIKGVYPIELIYLSEKLTLSKDELSLISMVEDMPYKLFGFKKDPDNIYKGI